MTLHLLRHLKQNTIAYVALFVALGGTSYASVKIPQLANAHSSAKAGVTCQGSCPASSVFWAYVGVTGGPAAVVPTAPQVYQTAIGGDPAQVIHMGVGNWEVFFQAQDLTNCARFVNLTHQPGMASVSGFDHTIPVTSQGVPDPTAIHILTTNTAGQPADLDFVVLALCGGDTKGLFTRPLAPTAP